VQADSIKGSGVARDGREPRYWIVYPESLRPIAAILSNMVRQTDDILSDEMLLFAIPAVVQFFDGTHANHARAAELLRRHEAHGQPFGLYLRNFASAGMQAPPVAGDWGGIARPTVFTGEDEAMRRDLAGHLPAGLPLLSCFNDLNLVWPKPGQEAPIFRLLSHNWQDVIRAVIDAAHCIVIFAASSPDRASGDGLELEFEAVRAAGQGGRCIVLAPARGYLPPVPVHACFRARDADFLECLSSLARSPPVPRRPIARIAAPPCWMVDRGYAASDFGPGRLSEEDYGLLVPAALEGNARLMTDQFDRLLSDWAGIEAELVARNRFDRKRLTDVLNRSLALFAIATTLDTLEAMARALMIFGFAHRVLSRSVAVAGLCAAGAATLATLARLPDLAANLRAVETFLAREAAPA
jgi:hypothetical protein